MARQARWAVAGLVHHVLLTGHNGGHVFTDDVDRALFLRALREAAAAHAVEVLGLAMPGDAVHLLLRPPAAAALGAVMQALGRRFVGAYNTRHGRSGTPWNGRFRAAPLEPGPFTLQALLHVDGLHQAQLPEGAAPGRWRMGQGLILVDPPELWALGNTPFEREQAYAFELERGTTPEFERLLMSAVLRGVPAGGGTFLASLEQTHGRPAKARPRGRPRRVG